jgi:hypothetical protein
LRYRRRRIGVFRTLRKANRRQGDPIMSNHKQAETDPLREIENGISAAFAEMFSSKPIKIPGPDHPITITPTKGQITVVVAGKRVADTREALTLKEAAYPAVQYIPRKDIDQTQLQRTSHQTYCPYKILMRRTRLALQELGPSMEMLMLPGGYLIALTGLIHRHWPLGSGSPR